MHYLLHVELANQFSMSPKLVNVHTLHTAAYDVFSHNLAESLKVHGFLTKELVESGAFKHPHFNLWSLARSPTCRDNIRGFIHMVEWNLSYISEQRTLEHLIRLICQETTMEGIGIRRCIVLVYEFIHSLQEDERNPHHQSLGTRLMQRGEPQL